MEFINAAIRSSNRFKIYWKDDDINKASQSVVRAMDHAIGTIIRAKLSGTDDIEKVSLSTFDTYCKQTNELKQQIYKAARDHFAD